MLRDSVETCMDMDIVVSKIIPRLRTVSVGLFTVFPLGKVTAGMRRLLCGDKATKNSVLSLFNFSMLHVIQHSMSLMHFVRVDSAESTDGVLDGSKLVYSCISSAYK